MAVTQEQIDLLLNPLVARTFADGRAGVAERAKRGQFTTEAADMSSLYDKTGSVDGITTDIFNFDAAGRVQQGSPVQVLERNWEARDKFGEIKVGIREVEALLNGGDIPREMSMKPRILARAYEKFLEQVAADAFNYGFAASGKTRHGFNSVGLFSDTHSIGNQTVDNNLTLALSSANVGTAIDMLDALTDGSGDVAGFTADTLMVPTALQSAAWAIVTELGAGGNPTYANYRISNFIVNPYLTDTNAWFVLDQAAAKEHLAFRSLNGRPSATDAEVTGYIDHSTRAVVWQLGRTFDFNWDDPRFAVGSNPS